MLAYTFSLENLLQQWLLIVKFGETKMVPEDNESSSMCRSRLSSNPVYSCKTEIKKQYLNQKCVSFDATTCSWIPKTALPSSQRFDGNAALRLLNMRALSKAL